MGVTGRATALSWLPFGLDTPLPRRFGATWCAHRLCAASRALRPPARGRRARPRLEGAGEGARLGEAEGGGDLGDLPVLHEEALRRLEFRLLGEAGATRHPIRVRMIDLTAETKSPCAPAIASSAAGQALPHSPDCDRARGRRASPHRTRRRPSAPRIRPAARKSA